MSRDKLIPEQQLGAVVTALYAEAERLQWDTLGPNDRTRAYSAWVEASHIGGVLTRYMTPEAARTWIKDGPMKEYSRARRGAGRYKRFGRPAGTTALDIARHTLGQNATIVVGTEGDKPFHCRVELPDREVFLVWGEARNYRNLLWAALRTSVIDNIDAHIVVMEPPGQPTPTEDVRLHKAIAKRCGLTAHHMREHLAPLQRTADDLS
jgi:hypothetical protein